MPLQFLPLQQRQKIQPRSVVSEALTPRPRPAQGPVGGGFAEAGGTMPNRFVEEQKARWAEEDKLKKLERDRSVEEAQEMGMRIRAAYEKEKLGGRQMSAQAAAGAPGAAPTAAPITKENMPQAAKAMWDFILTLDEAGQKFFINQLKQKEQPTGGFIEAGGVRKEMPGSVGMYGHLVDQGLIDPATDTVIEKEREFEKGTFEEDSAGNLINTATGETIARSGDDPEVKVDAIVKQIRSDALAIVKADPDISLEDATHDAAIDYKLSEEEAIEIAKFTEMPEGAKKKNAFIEWFKNWDKRVRQYGREMQEKYTPKAFNEDIARTLVKIISDDVTAAERAHFKTQGASDADIDEAIKRKGK